MNKLLGIAIKIINRLYPFPGPYFAYLNVYYLHIKQAISLIKEKHLQQEAVVDVGAATGMVSAMFARHLPDTPIYAFEPIKESYAQVVEQSKKYPNIHPVPKALGASKYMHEINVANRVNASSLFELNPQSDNNFITDNIKLLNKETIEISTLDEELPADLKISVLKLDVQGFEIEALKGATNTLKKTRMVLVELSNHDYYLNGAKYYEVDDFLRKSGFELLSFIPSLEDKGKILEWDSIYVNKNLA